MAAFREAALAWTPRWSICSSETQQLGSLRGTQGILLKKSSIDRSCSSANPGVKANVLCCIYQFIHAYTCNSVLHLFQLPTASEVRFISEFHEAVVCLFKAMYSQHKTKGGERLIFLKRQ